MPEYKALNTVTDRFSLYQNARKGRQNGRKYVLSAVKAMLESPETQEGLRLGELYGYYGHGRRAAYHSQYGTLDLPEVSVLQVDGKPIVLENVPACRTIAINVDDDGVVTHTQEILDTPSGQVLNGMIKSHAGGWSWATAGADMPGVAVPKSYHGCDYVMHPNFVSLDHPASMMTESADTRNQAILEGLHQSGFSPESAQSILQHYERMCGTASMLESTMRVQELELAQLESVGYQMALASELKETKAMLESVRGEVSSLRNAEQERQSQLDDLLDDLPIFVSHKQRAAIMDMNNPSQTDVLKALFESVAKTNLALSPVARKQVVEQIKAEEANKPKVEDHQLADVSFTPTYVEFR